MIGQCNKRRKNHEFMQDYKKAALIYKIIIFIPFVNLSSFFVWAIHLSYCLIATPLKKISDVLIRPAVSLLAMAAAWKTVSAVYIAITDNFGKSILSEKLFIYFVGLAIGGVCCISSAMTEKQRKKILRERASERDQE